ncbi:MAG: hypothetical protein NDF52_09360 [archaeon YNP-WB-062]|nr:hypothetical protein [Candidatus Culexarchaeum yellowstonense]
MDRFIEGEILPFCRKNDITIIAYKPFRKGALLKDSYRRILEKDMGGRQRRY